MKKCIPVLTATLINSVILIISVASAFAWPIVHPTGATLYDPSQADNGYTLFTPLGKKPKTGSSTVFLINMHGAVVHRWKVPLFAVSASLLPNGNLLFVGESEKKTPGRPGIGQFWIGGAAGLIRELTWGGKTVFEYEDVNMHHDVLKLPNGHYLYLAWERVPKALQAKVRGGIKGSEFPGLTMFNDYIVEVDAQGRVVWRWHANDHLDPDIDIIGPIYKRQEWCHANSIGVLQNGNILLTSRSLDALMVIDKATGKIIFRWGNASYLDKKSGRLEYRSGSNVMGGPHGAQEIPSGYPGAGHLLCYDNGLYTYRSRVVEIDVATRQLVWQSASAGLGRERFSWFSGNGQRLSNGNTLICDGANGSFYQETSQHKMVWEYISPYMTLPVMQGAVFKAHHYEPGYCPQLKALPPAGGTAIVPPGNARLKILPEQTNANSKLNIEQQPDLVPLAPALGALVLFVILFWFLRRTSALSQSSRGKGK
ncbi:MAG TPA: aryl-sulfate sulfotransferase, partial [Abditibacteriaceae bacterium]|nr:aryl-sulfate sulfotransferase [Abditibacteriaceae bacterium]